jgi:hypothetical protein
MSLVVPDSGLEKTPEHEKVPAQEKASHYDSDPSSEDGEALEISEKKLLRKLDLRLLPPLALLYLLSFLDRSNGRHPNLKWLDLAN